MPTGLQTVMHGAAAARFDPARIPGAVFYVDTSRSAITKANVLSGTGASLTKSGSNVVINGLTGMSANYSGGTITLSGYANAENNGSFSIISSAGNSCTIVNAAGVSESGGGPQPWAVEGMCGGITDLVHGATFTQAAIANQLAICTTEGASGKPVIGATATAARWLGLDDGAIAGALNGPGPSTWFLYFQPLLFPGSAFTAIQVRDQPIGTAPVSFAAYQPQITATSGRSLNLTTSLGNSTTYGITSGLTTFVAGQWYSLVGVYEAGTVDWYIDNVFIMTATGVARSLVTMRQMIIGMSSGSSGTPSSGHASKFAGFGVWAGDIGTDNIGKLHASYRAWLP